MFNSNEPIDLSDFDNGDDGGDDGPSEGGDPSIFNVFNKYKKPDKLVTNEEEVVKEDNADEQKPEQETK